MSLVECPDMDLVNFGFEGTNISGRGLVSVVLEGLEPKFGLISSIVKFPSPFLSSFINDLDAFLSSFSEIILSPFESSALITGNDQSIFLPEFD